MSLSQIKKNPVSLGLLGHSSRSDEWSGRRGVRLRVGDEAGVDIDEDIEDTECQGTVDGSKHAKYINSAHDSQACKPGVNSSPDLAVDDGVHQPAGRHLDDDEGEGGQGSVLETVELQGCWQGHHVLTTQWTGSCNNSK